MDSVTRMRVAYALRKQGVGVEVIAQEVERDRATVYRWLRGVRWHGIEGYIRRYRRANQGRRIRKTHSLVEQQVLRLRREYRNCCGQKLVYLLRREGVELSLSTVYRILNKHLTTPRKHTRTARGEPAQRGIRLGEVIQMDTMDFGEVFGFTAIDTYSKQAALVMRPGLTAQDGQAALEVFVGVFGKARVIQTDGGSEFEKEFAQTVTRYCDEHVVARPYKKNDQAFIECFNGTLRREEFGKTPFRAADLALAQRRADAYLNYYHHRRPHLALDMKTPAQFIAESHLP